MKVIFQIVIAQFRMFLRDHTTLLLTFALPLILGTFFAVLFSNEAATKVSIGLVNKANEPSVSYAFERIKKECDSNKIKFVFMDELDAIKKVRSGEICVAAIFPEGSTAALTGNDSVIVRVIANSNGDVKSAISMQLIQTIISEINVEVSKTPRYLQVEEIDVSIKRIELSDFYLPNFLALSVLWISLFATALPLVRQRERLILLRLGITPIRPTNLLVGLGLWRIVLGIVQTILFIAAGSLVIHHALPNHLLLLFLFVLIGNFAFLSIGLFLAGISKNSQAAETICQFVNFPMMFLSGIFFTPDTLPSVFNLISYAIPLTYLADSYRQLMYGYPGQFSLTIDAFVLTLIGLGFFIGGIKMWRWR